MDALCTALQESAGQLLPEALAMLYLLELCTELIVNPLGLVFVALSMALQPILYLRDLLAIWLLMGSFVLDSEKV